MRDRATLLEGPIGSVLVRLALPLMGVAFVQMAYTLTDVMWLGRLSTRAVAATGTCSFFVWLSQALTLIGKTGVSVGLAQSYGRGDWERAKGVMKAGLFVSGALCLFTMVVLFLFRKTFLGFYGLPPEVEAMAESYLLIVTAGMVFTFLNPLLAATHYARGDSMTPFKISLVALIFNIVADPILIFGIGPFPAMGVAGAAIATVSAQALALPLYLYAQRGGQSVLMASREAVLSSLRVKEILHLGIPACLHSSIHASVGLVLNKYIAGFGPEPIAVYAIGSQIESLSWMSAEGFGTAISAFMGQNYGAKRYDRLWKGYLMGLRIVGTIGILATIILFVGRDNLFRIFLPGDPKTVLMGGRYLMIMSASQFMMTVELGTTGALNGLGLTRYPAIGGAFFNILRIPMALLLMPHLAIEGVWWSMSISSICKGLFALCAFLVLRNLTQGFQVNMDRFASHE